MNEVFIFVLSVANIVWLLHLLYRANRHGFEVVSPFRFMSSLVIPFSISLRAVKKRKLSLNGAILAFWMGMCTCIADITVFVSLLTFYCTSNKLTKWKASRKVYFSTRIDRIMILFNRINLLRIPAGNAVFFRPAYS